MSILAKKSESSNLVSEEKNDNFRIFRKKIIFEKIFM